MNATHFEIFFSNFTRFKSSYLIAISLIYSKFTLFWVYFARFFFSSYSLDVYSLAIPSKN